ncbi:MAG: hypothetical protein R3F62_21515 [Planctomycetota bacterium]
MSLRAHVVGAVFSLVIPPLTVAGVLSMNSLISAPEAPTSREVSFAVERTPPKPKPKRRQERPKPQRRARPTAQHRAAAAEPRRGALGGRARPPGLRAREPRRRERRGPG